MDSNELIWWEYPDSHIRGAAEQFCSTAELLFRNLKEHEAVSPLKVNAALAIELFLKSLNAEWKRHSISDTDDAFEITSHPNRKGHDLLALFDVLPEPIRNELSTAFAVRCQSQTLRAQIELYRDAFEANRYPFEARNEPRFGSLNGILRLATFFRDHISAIPVQRLEREEPREGSDDREALKKSLRSEFNRSLDERVDRYLAVNHQPIVGDHHFAHASSECLNLYRDGYFLSCVMATQAVAEGIAKFVDERNGCTRQKDETNQDVLKRFQLQGVVTKSFVEAFERLQRSFRNDYHHMNPPVGSHDHEGIAKRNIVDLASLEREIFECRPGPEGTLEPLQRKYWDIGANGVVPVWFRQS